MLANAPEHGTLLRVREALAKRGFNALVGIAFLMIMVTVTMNVMMVATVVLMVVVIAMSMAMIVRCWQWLMVAMHFSRCFQSRVLCYSVVALAVRDLVLQLFWMFEVSRVAKIWCSCLSSQQLKFSRALLRASIITNTILGVPYSNYSIMGPNTLL